MCSSVPGALRGHFINRESLFPVRVICVSLFSGSSMRLLALTGWFLGIKLHLFPAVGRPLSHSVGRPVVQILLGLTCRLYRHEKFLHECSKERASRDVRIQNNDIGLADAVENSHEVPPRKCYEQLLPRALRKLSSTT